MTTFLIESKMNEEQTRALVEMVPNYEMFKTRLANARNPVNGQKIADDNARFAGTTLGTQKAGQASLYAAQLEAGKQREALEAEMPGAEADLVAAGLDTNPAFKAGNFLRNLQSGFSQPGRQQRIEQQALARLRKRARVGFSPIEIAAGADRDPLGAPGGMAQVSVAGGFDAAGAAAQFYKDMIDLQVKQLEELKKQNAGGGGAPPIAQAPPVLPAGPAPPQRRPGP